MLMRNALRAGAIASILGVAGCAAYPTGYGPSGYSSNYYAPGGYDVSGYYGSPYYGSGYYGYGGGGSGYYAGGLLLGGRWGDRDHDRWRDRNGWNGWAANRWQGQQHPAWNGWGSGWRGQQQAGGSRVPSFFGGTRAAPAAGVHASANPGGSRSAAPTFFGGAPNR